MSSGNDVQKRRENPFSTVWFLLRNNSRMIHTEQMLGVLILAVSAYQFFTR